MMKRAQQCLVIGAALALVGCKGGGKPWTVLSIGEAAKLRRPCSREFPKGLTGSWSPAPADIEAPEKMLDAAIAQELARVGTQAKLVPPKYNRQYAGFERAGRGVIYLNAFAVDAPGVGADRDAWRAQAVRVCDGGISSFGAVFDPVAGTFDSFRFDPPLGKANEPAPM